MHGFRRFLYGAFPSEILVAVSWSAQLIVLPLFEEFFVSEFAANSDVVVSSAEVEDFV
jgi:hypothetical protein